MKSVVYWGCIVLLGLMFGFGSALAVLKNRQLSGGISVGPWHTGASYGSKDADMYTRARVALYGLLALDRKETMYYVAAEDSDGAPLAGNCTYRVEGKDLAARWWSITAYGADSFLIPNDAGIYSYSKTTLKPEANGGYVIRVSADRQEGNWLPVKAGQEFDLTARFYNPEPSVYENPAGAELPRIVKEGCK